MADLLTIKSIFRPAFFGISLTVKPTTNKQEDCKKCGSTTRKTPKKQYTTIDFFYASTENGDLQLALYDTETTDWPMTKSHRIVNLT